MFEERGFQFYQSYADTERATRGAAGVSAAGRHKITADCRIGSMTALLDALVQAGETISPEF